MVVEVDDPIGADFQLLVRVVLRVESKEFHAVGHQLSKYMKDNTIVNQG